MPELKQLKDNETGQQMIYKTISDALVIVDEKAVIAYVNQTAENIFGYSTNEMIGKNIYMLLHDKKQQKNKEPEEQSALFAASTLNQIRVVGGLRKNGSKFSLEVNVTSMEINGLHSYVCVFQEITERKLAADNLSETSQLLDSIVENVPNMIFLKRASDLRFEFLNRAGEKLLGLDRAVLLGCNDYDLFPKKQADFFTEKDREVLKQKGAVDIPEETIETPSGLRILHTQKITLRDEQGKAKYLLGISEDITESKQAEKELRRFKSTLDQTLDCVFMFDADSLCFFYVNEGAMQQVGYTHEELLVMHPYDIKPEFPEPQFRETISPLLSGEKPSLNFETVHQHKNGQQVPVEVFLQYIVQENESARFVAVVRDITERRKTEAELAKYREHLEELVEERAQELRDAQDELVRKERLATLGQVTATVSHELRNPLGAMRPSLYVIEERCDKEDERIQQAIGRLDENINRCDEIIEELLDFTRITKLDKDVIRVDEWLESVINEQEISAEIQVSKDFTLKNIEVEVDTSRLRRAIINVVDNACHAILDEKNLSNAKQGLHLKFKTRASDKRIEIVITDTGVGIAENLLEKIFEPLFSTKGFGVGLGMSTVKQIMEQHEGGIEIETKADYGTTITLWLPRNIV